MTIAVVFQLLITVSVDHCAFLFLTGVGGKGERGMRNSPVDTKVSEGMERGASGTAAEIALLPTQRPWWSRGGGRVRRKEQLTGAVVD